MIEHTLHVQQFKSNKYLWALAKVYQFLGPFSSGVIVISRPDYTPCHCTVVVVFMVKKGKAKLLLFCIVVLGKSFMLLQVMFIMCLFIAVELKVRNWTKFNVRAACRPLESGQWIQTLAPDIPPTANSTATVRIICNYRTSVFHIWCRTM